MLLVQSCEEDELVRERTNQRFVTSSEENFNNTVEIDDVITFADVSPGVVSREWSVDSGVAILTPSITPTDNGTLTSSENIINAFFKQLGTHEVRLNQVYDADAYIGSRLAGKVLDTIITVTVIDAVDASVTANIVNNDGTLGEPLNMADGAKNEIFAGSTVRYFAQSSGQAAAYTWTAEGATPEVSNVFADEIDVKYTRLGDYDFTFSAGRARPLGSFNISYENLVSIIPSTEPVTLDRSSVTADGIIKLEFSREIDVTTINIADFSVTLENAGTPLTSNISEITTDPDAANILFITLDGEQIFSDDVTTFTYIQGSMLSTDAYLIDSFENIVVDRFEGENLFATSPGFDPFMETGNVWPVIWGSQGSSELSTDQAQEGSSSIFVEVGAHADGQFAWMQNGATVLGVETDKTYELGVWIYLEDLGTPGAITPDIRMYWQPAGGDIDFSAGVWVGFDGALPAGEWVYRSTNITFAATTDYSTLIRGWNQDNASSLKFYMDNISIKEVNLR